MFEHLYFQGSRTRLMEGDVIRTDDGHKFIFYREEERLLVATEGDPENKKDALLTLSYWVDFLATITLATGLDMVETQKSKEKSMVASEWQLQNHV